MLEQQSYLNSLAAEDERGLTFVTACYQDQHCRAYWRICARLKMLKHVPELVVCR
jgi:hypothetical protein